MSKWIFLARSFTRMEFYFVRCLFADTFYFNIHHRLHWLNQVSYNIARLPHKEIPIKKFCLLNDRAFTRKKEGVRGDCFVTTSLTNHSEVSPYLLIFFTLYRRYIVCTQHSNILHNQCLNYWIKITQLNITEGGGGVLYRKSSEEGSLYTTSVQLISTALFLRIPEKNTADVKFHVNWFIFIWGDTFSFRILNISIELYVTVCKNFFLF